MTDDQERQVAAEIEQSHPHWAVILPAELDGRRFYDLLRQDVWAKVSQQFTCLLAQQHPRFTEPMISFHQKTRPSSAAN